MGTNKDEVGSDDPFACFDSSDDEEDGSDDDASGQADQQQQQQQIQNEEEEQSRRDPGNGVLAFHAGTEIALLHHIKTQLQLQSAPAANIDTGTDVVRTMIHNAQTVLNLVDSYCLSRHWMMHVGPEKATPLRKFICDCLVEKEKTRDGSSAFTFVELGTYCGYSSIFFAKTMLKHYWNDGKTTAPSDDDFSFHIYSVEVVEKFAAVAKELIRLAGMEAYITVILMKDPDAITTAARRDGEEGLLSLSSELKSRLPDVFNNHSAEDASSCTTTTIDFLFVDHDKSMYLPNLQELEDAGMIRKGTHVAADNVVFAEIDDYRHYMADLATKGIAATRLEDSLMVEYCHPELLLVQQQEESGSETTMAGAGGEAASEKNKDGENNASTTAAITKDMLRDGIEFSVYLKDPR